MPRLPEPRGPVSEQVIAALSGRPVEESLGLPALPADPLGDDDLQLALYACYELHYRGFDGVDPRWEWDPGLLRLRARLEAAFESALVDLAGEPGDGPAAEDMDLALRAIANDEQGPSVSAYIEAEASIDQVREFMIHRSAYQLKEADPHTWAIPRLAGAPKAALVEIQADEYGGGRADRVHATMFARSMDAVGLDSTYGAYLDSIPASALASVNLMSLFGLHRRLRGAITGHLALFEMSSSVPNRRYANGLRRLGFDGEATEFFDEHVVADAVHENIAAVDLAGGLARDEPGLGGQIVWGARCLTELDRLWAESLIGAWQNGQSALLELVDLRDAWCAEADPLVGTVAKRPQPRLAATTESYDFAAGLDLGAVLVDDSRRPAYEQRPVAVGSDDDLGTHRSALPR